MDNYLVDYLKYSANCNAESQLLCDTIAILERRLSDAIAERDKREQIVATRETECKEYMHQKFIIGNLIDIANNMVKLNTGIEWLNETYPETTTMTLSDLITWLNNNRETLAAEQAKLKEKLHKIHIEETEYNRLTARIDRLQERINTKSELIDDYTTKIASINTHIEGILLANTS